MQIHDAYGGAGVVVKRLENKKVIENKVEVNLPIVNLKYRQTSVLRQLLFLFLRGIRVLEMDKEQNYSPNITYGSGNDSTYIHNAV